MQVAFTSLGISILRQADSKRDTQIYDYNKAIIWINNEVIKVNAQNTTKALKKQHYRGGRDLASAVQRWGANNSVEQQVTQAHKNTKNTTNAIQKKQTTQQAPIIQRPKPSQAKPS